MTEAVKILDIFFVEMNKFTNFVNYIFINYSYSDWKKTL